MEEKKNPVQDPDDWSNPEEHARMSAGWPLLWMAIPLIAILLWGLFSGA